MSPAKKPISDVDVPDIQKCPNCGNNIFLGETECSQCGYDVANWQQKLQQLNTQVIAGILFLFGLILTVSAFNQKELVQLILIGLGMGLIVAGGLVMTAEYFLEDILREIKRRLNKN